MTEKQLYITRPEGVDPYLELQRQTLGELQRLAGEEWTDYNPHDPGVTIAEAANYALTETGYKLGFALDDYLAGRDGTWTEEMYGLFPPHKVYPSAPVTADDYRRLVLAHFPMVENLKVNIRSKSGQYDFILRLSPFFVEGHAVPGCVRSFLNRHRNLCERIGDIRTERTEELSFHADFEIDPGKDATDILVQIYRTAMNYLSGCVEIKSPEKDGTLPMREDEWYDGPVLDVRADIPRLRNTEDELYWQLRQIPGIVSFKTCYFRDRNGKAVSDFRNGYSLQVPEDFRNVVVRIGTEKADTDMQGFIERLRAGYFMRSTFRVRRFMQEREGRIATDGGKYREAGNHKYSAYHSVFRNVYGHNPIADDLPLCYGTSERDFPHDTPARERARTRNFGNYLRLFDLILQRGLIELDGLKRLLSIDDADECPSRMRTLPEDVLSMRKHNDRYRDIVALKNRNMDFLDGLYGVDSNPEWLSEFEYYGQTEDDRLQRRMRFLTALPQLVRDRSRSFDTTGGYSGENVPAVKKYLSLLLDFNSNEEHSAGNILPGHNLILTDDRERGKRLRGPMNSRMIDDVVFSAEAVMVIGEDEPPRTIEEKLARDEELRRNLPIFNSRRISGTLFREGIVLSNYNLVQLDNGEWLLVFRGKQEESRMNLGRSDNKEKLTGWANTLCRYLRRLNRLCEAVYVVEKGLFGTGDPFVVMLVFTGWTARTHSPRFRKACTQLARSLIPAHLKMETYWLGAVRMQYFEKYHRKWRNALQNNAPEETRVIFQDKILQILTGDILPARGTEDDQEINQEGPFKQDGI